MRAMFAAIVGKLVTAMRSLYYLEIEVTAGKPKQDRVTPWPLFILF